MVIVCHANLSNTVYLYANIFKIKKKTLTKEYFVREYQSQWPTTPLAPAEMDIAAIINCAIDDLAALTSTLLFRYLQVKSMIDGSLENMCLITLLFLRRSQVVVVDIVLLS